MLVTASVVPGHARPRVGLQDQARRRARLHQPRLHEERPPGQRRLGRRVHWHARLRLPRRRTCLEGGCTDDTVARHRRQAAQTERRRRRHDRLLPGRDRALRPCPHRRRPGVGATLRPCLGLWTRRRRPWRRACRCWGRDTGTIGHRPPCVCRRGGRRSIKILDRPTCAGPRSLELASRRSRCAEYLQ